MSSIKVRVLPDRTVEIEGGDPEEVRRVLSCLVDSASPPPPTFAPPPSPRRKHWRARDQILDALRRAGPDGATARQLMAQTGMGRSHVCWACRALERDGVASRKAVTCVLKGPFQGKPISCWVLVESANGGGA